MASLAEASRQLKAVAAQALAAGRFDDLERLAAALRCLSSSHPTSPGGSSGGVLRQIASQLAPQRNLSETTLPQTLRPIELSSTARAGSAGKQVNALAIVVFLKLQQLDGLLISSY